MKRTLASYLSRIACWLRGEKWYVADNLASVPGNRAAELKQAIWEQCVILWDKRDAADLKPIERKLEELAQLAGENWGHCDRREK